MNLSPLPIKSPWLLFKSGTEEDGGTQSREREAVGIRTSGRRSIQVHAPRSLPNPSAPNPDPRTLYPKPHPPNPNPKPKPKQIRLNQISKLNQSKTPNRIKVKRQTKSKDNIRLNQSTTPNAGLSNSIADEVLEALEVTTWEHLLGHANFSQDS